MKVWSNVYTILKLRQNIGTLSHHSHHTSCPVLFFPVPYVFNIKEGKCKKFGFAFLDSCNK